MKRSFFQAAVVSILLYGCTSWTLTKRQEKKLDGNYTRRLRAILNKSWRQHPTKHQLYGYLLPITKTIQVRRTRHAGHCWRSKDEVISDVLLWTPTYGRAKSGRPARTYIQQLCEDTDVALKTCLIILLDLTKCFCNCLYAILLQVSEQFYWPSKFQTVLIIWTIVLLFIVTYTNIYYENSTLKPF